MELILLQFAIGIFTYGTDRLLDAINYNKDENKLLLYSDAKVNYYFDNYKKLPIIEWDEAVDWIGKNK